MMERLKGGRKKEEDEFMTGKEKSKKIRKKK